MKSGMRLLTIMAKQRTIARDRYLAAKARSGVAMPE
jgi:hypothetical protein